MSDLLKSLRPKERRGSKPRCHLLTHGSPDVVSARLTKLIAPWGTVTTDDRWMPQGFIHTDEAQFGRVDSLLDPAIGASLIKWWLASPKPGRVPHWDIAGTCAIEGKPGLFLVEAKAHSEELKTEEAGKRKRKVETADSRRNRAQIESCMKDANTALRSQTGWDWRLSIERCYQMSNRFAWAWELTALGFPVILMYLGFINSEEMADRGIPFADLEDWKRQVESHSQILFPGEVWGKRWRVNGQPFIPIIQSCQQELVV